MKARRATEASQEGLAVVPPESCQRSSHPTMLLSVHTKRASRANMPKYTKKDRLPEQVQLGESDEGCIAGYQLAALVHGLGCQQSVERVAMNYL